MVLVGKIRTGNKQAIIKVMGKLQGKIKNLNKKIAIIREID